jgi:AcrR family transcriptional regulator
MATKERPARRRTNDPEAMRGRILDAAADLFQRNGFHDTSVQDILGAASVTSGALHHHFPSKKQLGLAVVNDRVAAEVQATWIEPVQTAQDAVTGIRAAFTASADALRDQGFVRGCPLNNLAIELAFADPDFRRALDTVFDRWRHAISIRLREGSDGAGEAYAEELATLVVASYSGAMTMAKAKQTPEPLYKALRGVERLLGF